MQPSSPETPAKPRSRRRFRMRRSTVFVIGFTLVAGLLYAGWTLGVHAWVVGHKFAPILPGKVSLVGVATGHGYRILVANRVAQLEEAKDVDFTSDQGDASGSGDDAAGGDAKRKKLPVGDMVAALGGDVKALSSFTATLAGLEPNDDWPTTRIVWKAEDIDAALHGDKKRLAKLESDLNVDLDGRPLPQLNLVALENGIVVDTPVPIRVQVGDEQKVLIARIQRPYLPAVLRATQARFEKLFKVTDRQKVGFYVSVCQDLAAHPSTREDVRAKLETLADSASLADAAREAEKMLGGAEIVLSDRFMSGASYRESSEETSAGGAMNRTYDLDLHVTPEGRMRLWKYSIEHPHAQLLLVSDGVAIAAPRISHELISSDLTIRNMPDEDLLKQAVASIDADAKP